MTVALFPKAKGIFTELMRALFTDKENARVPEGNNNGDFFQFDITIHTHAPKSIPCVDFVTLSKGKLAFNCKQITCLAIRAFVVQLQQIFRLIQKRLMKVQSYNLVQ
jgi:hypothetical protein